MASKKLRDQAISWFKKKYPKANMNKFEFGYNIDNSGNLKNADVYYKVTPQYKDRILITDKQLKNNEQFIDDLFGDDNSNNQQMIESNINKDSGLRFPKI